MSRRAIAAGALQLQVLPPPNNIAESRRILAHLKTYGAVTSYKMLRHINSLCDYTPKAQVIFRHSADAQTLLAASPVRTPEGVTMRVEPSGWDHEHFVKMSLQRMTGGSVEGLQDEMTTGFVQTVRSRGVAKYTGGFNGFKEALRRRAAREEEEREREEEEREREEERRKEMGERENGEVVVARAVQGGAGRGGEPPLAEERGWDLKEEKGVGGKGKGQDRRAVTEDDEGDDDDEGDEDDEDEEDLYEEGLDEEVIPDDVLDEKYRPDDHEDILNRPNVDDEDEEDLYEEGLDEEVIPDDVLDEKYRPDDHEDILNRPNVDDEDADEEGEEKPKREMTDEEKEIVRLTLGRIKYLIRTGKLGI